MRPRGVLLLTAEALIAAKPDAHSHGGGMLEMGGMGM